MPVYHTIIRISLLVLHLVWLSTPCAQEGDGKFLNEITSKDVEPTLDVGVVSIESSGTNLISASTETKSVKTQPKHTVVRPPIVDSDSKSSVTISKYTILERVQLMSEPGLTSDEKLISGYFIFRDKPSSYSYEVKVPEKQLIFQFNDTKIDSSPFPTALESPINVCFIEEDTVNLNKVGGATPEWHNLTRVVFDLETVPNIHVYDEYNIISFVFKWSSDPSKQKKYTANHRSPKGLLYLSAMAGGAGIGALVYQYLLPQQPQPVNEPLGNLLTDDLPVHPTVSK